MLLWVTNLRTLAIISVVTIHVAAVFMLRNDNSMNEWFYANFFNSLSRWCVPILVAITGLLLFNQNQKLNYLSFYKKRLAKILIPTIFWISFYTFWNFTKGLFGKSHSYNVLVNNIIDGHAYYHLWYLYMLVPLYFFAPFIVNNLRNLRFHFAVVILFFLLSIGMQATTNEFHQYQIWCFWFIAYLNYFLLGGLIQKLELRANPKIVFSIFALSVVATFVGYGSVQVVFFNSVNHEYFYTYSSFNVAVMACSVLILFKSQPFFNKNHVLPYLSDKTFGVYLVHPFIIDFLFFVLSRFDVSVSAFSIPLFVMFVVFFAAFVVHFISSIPYIRKVV